jgi:hypothetical protein
VIEKETKKTIDVEGKIQSLEKELIDMQVEFAGKHKNSAFISNEIYYFHEKILRLVPVLVGLPMLVFIFYRK